MKMVRFLIHSLLAAGFLVIDRSHAKLTDTPKIKTHIDDPPMIDVLRLEHQYNLAAHRSHSSHGSHRSHRSGAGGHGSHQSHRSSSTPAVPYTPPASPPSEPSRNYQSTPPSSVLPRSPSTAPRTLKGDSPKFAEIARKVQASLYLQGYYTGAIDGVVGPETRAAISKFQKDSNLPITGTITTEVLNALGIAAK